MWIRGKNQIGRLIFTFAKPFTDPAGNVGIAKNNERNDENIFTEVFSIKANDHNKNKR